MPQRGREAERPRRRRRRRRRRRGGEAERRRFVVVGVLLRSAHSSLKLRSARRDRNAAEIVSEEV